MKGCTSLSSTQVGPEAVLCSVLTGGHASLDSCLQPREMGNVGFTRDGG